MCAGVMCGREGKSRVEEGESRDKVVGGVCEEIEG